MRVLGGGVGLDVHKWIEELPSGAGLQPEDTSSHTVRGRTPAAVLAPTSPEAAAIVIRRAAEAEAALTIWGGGTAMETGFPPERMDLVLKTTGMDRVIDYQPDDQTITVQAGVTFASLERTLASRRQYLPVDAPLPARASVGGWMATATSGPWAGCFGTPRDWIIGCRVIDGVGAEVRGGGQVVKNVAGYDLPKLYTGSYGSLGLIHEVTLKVSPRPASEGYSLVSLRTAADAEAFLAALADSDVQPSIQTLLNRPAADRIELEPVTAWTLLLQFLDVPAAVAWQQDAIRGLLPGDACVRPVGDEAGRAAVSALRDLPCSLRPAVRVHLSLGEVTLMAESLAELSDDLLVFAHSGAGHLWVGSSALPEQPAAVLQEVIAEAPHLFVHLPAAAGDDFNPWGPAGPGQKLMYGVKGALDAGRLFSPGRFAGKL